MDGWAQGFVLPPGGGQLSIMRNDLAHKLSLAVELIAVLAVCLLALPGKRADPVAEAGALAALREARTGRRADPAPRPARARAAGRRAAGGPDRPAFPRSRRADQAPALVADRDEGFVEQVRVEQETAAGLVDGQHAGYGPVDDDQAGFRTTGELGAGIAGDVWSRAGETPRTEPLQGAAFWSAPDDAVSVPDLPDGDPQHAPWDMAGDWGSHSQAAATGAWATNPLEDAWGTSPLEDAGLRGARARRTGQQPSVRETPVPDAQPPEIRAPWETGPQHVPWESGPQPQASSTGTSSTGTSSTGTQPRYAWESEAQPPASPTGTRATGARPRYPWESGPQRSAAWTGGQPAATGAQPRARTGAQPVAPGGAQPAGPDGQEPASAAPWESGEWPTSHDWTAAPDDGDALPARPEPDTGSGPWPLASRPAGQERHSHRAAKHGRPSRWRGAGSRSTGDGES